LPSFHMIWSILVAEAIGRGRRFPVRVLLWLWVAMIAVSCVMTGAHTIADVAVGGVLGALLLRVERNLLAARGTSHRAVAFAAVWSLLVILLSNRLWIAGVAESLMGGVFLMLTGAGLFLAQALNSNLPGPYWRGWPLCQWTAGFLAAAGAAVTVANPSHNALGTILLTALCVIPLTRFANGQPQAAGRDLQQL
ncbi:MAG: phosphatase PAP2 family protein, partial [Bryobacteraceae bacterium]